MSALNAVKARQDFEKALRKREEAIGIHKEYSNIVAMSAGLLGFVACVGVIAMSPISPHTQKMLLETARSGLVLFMLGCPLVNRVRAWRHKRILRCAASGVFARAEEIGKMTAENTPYRREVLPPVLCPGRAARFVMEVCLP